MWRKWSISIVLVLSLLGCNKEEPSGPMLLEAKDYFPLTEGSYWIHKVTFINIDVAVNVYDTLQLEIRSELMAFDSTLDQYPIERLSRLDSLSEWLPYDNLLVSWENNLFFWVEDNKRYIKLIDPVYDDKSWDGNSYNILDPSNYYYSDLNTTFEMSGTSFSHCIKVNKRTISNAIQKSNAYEIFAKNIGSVYEYNADFYYQAGMLSTGNSRESILIKFSLE